jgi:5-methylcytosine-specific restriction endonuclease McrA
MSACIGRKNKQLTILSQYNGRCGYCGEIDYLNIDHILPKSKGGTDR